MFPSHATLYAAPVQLDSYMQDMVGFWTRVYGFDMTPMAQKAVEDKLTGKKECYYYSAIVSLMQVVLLVNSIQVLSKYNERIESSFGGGRIS
jgi:hypothetical protein